MLAEITRTKNGIMIDNVSEMLLCGYFLPEGKRKLRLSFVIQPNTFQIYDCGGDFDDVFFRFEPLR